MILLSARARPLPRQIVDTPEATAPRLCLAVPKRLVVASVVAMLAFVWVAWLALRLFDRWSRRGGDTGDLLWHLVRAVVVISVLGWFVR